VALGTSAHAPGDWNSMNVRLRNLILIAAPLVAFPSVLGILTSFVVFMVLYQVVPFLNRQDVAKHKRIQTQDLLAVLEGVTLCLSAGLSIPQSMKYVGTSRESLAHQQLLSAWNVYEIGQDLPTALSQLEDLDPQWSLICRILSSTHVSGAPALAACDSLMEFLREETQSEMSTRIRSLAVKSVLPLGLCFLPAFLVLTVVPLVAQFIAQVQW